MKSEDPDDTFVSEEEETAASEAAAVGGTAGDEDLDEAERPVIEGGGGEAEGFDVAEQDLVDHAEHQEGEGIPRLDRFEVEAEPDPATYGEADEEEPPG